MKAAYHFNCSGIDGVYDRFFYQMTFSKLIRLNEPFISTKVFSGDLIAHELVEKAEDAPSFLNLLLKGNVDGWKRIINSRIEQFIGHDVFVICFETIQREVANKLHSLLENEIQYLGAFEIDNANETLWILYGERIGPRFRILNKEISIFIDSYYDEVNGEIVEHYQGLLKGIPFKKVTVEHSNYRYTILDDNHNFDNARRAAEWKKGAESLFSTITDEVISKLTDAAPELTDRLWTINDTFYNAQTGEKYALAMTSCRRLFEYVTDCLFPATDDIIDGHSLKKDKYKNRLLEFARRELRSDINIDLLVTNTASLFEEWKKLYELSNKGVHTVPHREECRRCIIRTILLLDDLIAIKRSAFEVNVKADSFFNDFLHSEDSES